jgi:hypothetical protein
VLNLTGGRRLEQNSWMFFGCKAGYVSGLVWNPYSSIYFETHEGPEFAIIFQTVFYAHPASYSVGTVTLSTGVKSPERKYENWTLSSGEV